MSARAAGSSTAPSPSSRRISIPALFIRVHRSVILRRDTITGLYRDDAGHWTARLRDGGEQRIGRSYIDNVKKLAGR